MEVHFHAKTFPTAEGYDVHTLDDLYPGGILGKTQAKNSVVLPEKLGKIYRNTPRQWSVHNWAFENRALANRPGKRRLERDPSL